MKSIILFCLFLVFPMFGLQAKVKFEYNFNFAGVKTCKMCHKKSSLGNQFGIWNNSAHANAFVTLKSPKAKKIGVKLDIAAPDKDDACLICHTTAFGASAKIAKKIKKEDGIQCERCHGPGKKYKSKMKKIAKERKTNKDGSSPTAIKTGLQIPSEQTCRECHVPDITFKGKKYINPAYKPFDFARDFTKISHKRN